MVTFNVTNPTGANLLNPGQDEYVKFDTQTSWSVGTGAFTVDVGVYLALGGVHLFPEYITGPGWPTPDYAAAHAFNCGNGHGQYGWSTYWFDAATINQWSGGVGKVNTQEVLDEKAMNCAPSAMFAAFCVWDGGQLATAEVMDSITGNATEPVYSNAGTAQTGKLAAGNSNCGAGNTLNTFSDGTQACYSLPNNAGFFPGIDNDYDSSAKIASPGRVAADVVVKTAGDEPWMEHDRQPSGGRDQAQRDDALRLSRLRRRVRQHHAPQEPGVHAAHEERRPRRTLHALQVALEVAT